MFTRKPGTKLYTLWDGAILLTETERATDMFRKIESWCKRWVHPPVISRQSVMPDGSFETSPRCIGGTWGGGHCGSTLWVSDKTFHTAWVQDYSSHDYCRTSQVWHSHWVLNDSPYFPPEKREEKALGGFRIECRQPHTHDGLCSEGIWVWDWRLPEMAENAFRRTGRAQQKLELM